MGKPGTFMSNLKPYEKLIGERFEDVEAATWVKTLWIARGHVAHGKELDPPFIAGNKMIDKDNIASIHLSAIKILAWLEKTSGLNRWEAQI